MGQWPAATLSDLGVGGRCFAGVHRRRHRGIRSGDGGMGQQPVARAEPGRAVAVRGICAGPVTDHPAPTSAPATAGTSRARAGASAGADD